MHSEEFENAPVPGLALEVGGGLSLGLAASLNPTASALLLGLGGLLPLVTSSFAIASHLCVGAMRGVAPAARTSRKHGPPAPHSMARPVAPAIGPHFRREPTPSGRFRPRAIGHRGRR